MSATIYQFRGAKHVHEIPIAVPQAQAQPLRALPCRLDCDDDSYRLSPALTVPSEMLKLACEALIFGCFVCGIFMMCFALGW